MGVVVVVGGVFCSWREHLIKKFVVPLCLSPSLISSLM